MTLKRKILISNLIMVLVPVLLTGLLFSGYHRIPRSTEENARQMLNLFYLFETELSGIDWNTVDFSVDAEYIPSPQMQKITELSEMGCHIEIISGKNVLFSNLQTEDMQYISYCSDAPSGCVCCAEKVFLLWDSFESCQATAVYNQENADIGVQNSVLSVWLISPSVMLIFIFVMLAGILMTNSLLTQWLNRSVVEPLEMLKESARQIESGNLESSVPYDRQDEFGIVCREFDSMREKLKSAEIEREQYEQSRRELLIGVSHDLRSPLTSVKGYAQGLKDGIASTEEKRQRYYDAILTRADDLERLTDSLSSLVRLEQSAYPFRFETVCLDEFLSQFLQEEKPYLIQSNVEIIYENHADTAEFSLDVREMRRVFSNLLENSVKYRNRDSSRIRLTVERPNENHLLKISFADDGSGVPEEQLGRIFEIFYRGDKSRTRPETGSGLGLAVVKRIVEGHGGAVSAKNDGGLCIEILLPERNLS